ncbi:MAG: DUF6677 family protein [Planctomycetota bacterium]
MTLETRTRKADMHYPFILQAGVGLPAIPAVIQSATGVSLFGDSHYMYPPADPKEQTHDEKAMWHQKAGQWFSMGTLFTMVAGIMNLLVVFDAYSGPAFGSPESQSTYGSGPPGEDSSESTLRFAGMVIGVVLALSLRANMESDSRLLTYAMAIAGGFAGSGVGRVINHIYRLIIPFPVAEGTDGDAPADDKQD